MYEQRACFFAWLIMPFNSRSTTPLHRIISQWSWLFLLSHALFPFFFLPSLQNESWIQPSLPGGERRAGEWADQSWASEANTQTKDAFCCRRKLPHLAWRRYKDWARGDRIAGVTCAFIFFSFSLHWLCSFLFAAYPIRTSLSACVAEH